jgi:hypothetical protein
MGNTSSRKRVFVGIPSNISCFFIKCIVVENKNHPVVKGGLECLGLFQKLSVRGPPFANSRCDDAVVELVGTYSRGNNVLTR